MKQRSERPPRHSWFYDQLYLFNFRLVWPVTKSTLEQYIRDEFPDIGQEYICEDDTFGGKAIFVPTEGRGGTYMVALRKWNGNSDDHSNLVHECLHVANMILHHRDVQITPDNDEALTYLTQYIHRQCLNVLLPKRLRVSVDPTVIPKGLSKCR